MERRFGCHAEPTLDRARARMPALNPSDAVRLIRRHRLQLREQCGPAPLPTLDAALAACLGAADAADVRGHRRAALVAAELHRALLVAVAHLFDLGASRVLADDEQRRRAHAIAS